MLDVIKGTPRYKKSKYPLAVNLAVLGMIFLRCVSVAYFVMGLVWKLHTGVIDESWISILNRLWIGNLRLGSTVNGLVLTSICLFPFYIISGCIGLLGIFCRKSLFVALYLTSLTCFVLVDVIFFSMFIVLCDGIGGSLALDFQNIYLQLTQTSLWSPDLKNTFQEWNAMFSTLGCCGITDRYVTPIYYHMNECFYNGVNRNGEICWGKFATVMRSYLTTFACFTAICLVIEIVQLTVVDFIYSQMTNQRFPFALLRTLVSMVKKSALARDRMLVVANILRILSCISGLSLVVLGTMILTDTKLTGQEVNGLFVFIYILGVNFRNIIDGFGIAMIVLGSIAFILNSLAIISDVVLQSKTKSKLITFLKVIILITEVTVLGIVIRFATEVNTDLRYKMANLLRNFDYLNRPWRIFFGELECCGVASSNDLCDMISGTTYCSNTLPYTCCHHSLYVTSESNLDNNNVCSNPNTIIMYRAWLAQHKMEIEIDHTEEVHDEEESFICEFCSKSFKHRSSLYRHLNAHKKELFKCNQCPKIFATRHYLNLHIKNVHTEPRNLLCPYCGRAYHTSCALSNHIRFKHKGGGNECSICERKFKDNYGLKRHLSSHEEKAQHCSICNKNFKNLKEHSKHCTKEKSEKRYTCHHCDKKYALRRCLKLHIKKTHETTPSYPCCCGKLFKYRSSLNRHKKACSKSGI